MKCCFLLPFKDTELLYHDHDGNVKMLNIQTNYNKTLVENKTFESFHSQVLITLINNKTCNYFLCRNIPLE